MPDGLKLDPPSSPSGLRWTADRGKAKAGAVCGNIDKSSGYWVVRTRGKLWRVHRIVYFAYHNRWVDVYDTALEVDHIDGNCANNAITNLRVGSKRNNCQNLKSHRAGRLVGAQRSGLVSLPWESTVRVGGGKRKLLGRFLTEQEAHLAYCLAVGIPPWSN